ncbi:DUF4268 domain-containing protein [Flavobacteriaceae bacterium TP-CH-4]|uniref:DUF4268 domain-containing protein n=1 Tax=Pelagihabitans pacificus TaxID=2696054 RepID=A0A967AXZ8_9FLAO|nr:DUF4268 domain-containing protein [Pelagihabitans pacificus]NHF61228.1 DUF4268 domain-containing protein [Pelagihabitans pacificus]
MFSKEESKRLRQDFWIAFGKSYPRKWILYHTNIKGLALKFHFDVNGAMVLMDIESSDLEKRIDLWEKVNALKSILIDDYLPDAKFDDAFILENQKEVSRIYVRKEGVSIHDKNSWQETMIFLNNRMKKLEAFFLEFRDILSP